MLRVADVASFQTPLPSFLSHHVYGSEGFSQTGRELSLPQAELAKTIQTGQTDAC